MKKIIIGSSLVITFSILTWQNFAGIKSVNITCEIRERTKETQEKVPPVTRTVHLRSEDAQTPDGVIVESQIVKDVKVHLSMNKASFNMFKLFGTQWEERAWQITQELEDLNLGARTNSYSVVSTFFGMPKTSNLKFFNRSNGDSVSADCYQDQMIQ